MGAVGSEGGRSVGGPWRWRGRVCVGVCVWWRYLGALRSGFDGGAVPGGHGVGLGKGGCPWCFGGGREAWCCWGWALQGKAWGALRWWWGQLWGRGRLSVGLCSRG